MKTLLVILSLVMGVSASALDAKQLTSKIMSSLGSSNPPPLAQPIRVAQARYKITRSEFVQQADGSYDSKRTTLCTGDIKVNVYDARGTIELTSANLDMQSCTDTAFAKQLSVSGAMILATEEIIDVKEDLKFAWGALYVSPADPSGGVVIQPIELMNMSSAGSKDLTASSFVINIMPDTNTMAPGSVYYSATLDIKD